MTEAHSISYRYHQREVVEHEDVDAAISLLQWGSDRGSLFAVAALDAEGVLYIPDIETGKEELARKEVLEVWPGVHITEVREYPAFPEDS